jgi:hypothetical protein
MAIQNGYGILNYRHRMQRNPPGTIATSCVVKIQPYANPLRAQGWTVAVGGTAANGPYSIVVTERHGASHEILVTRAAGVPATNADLAAALEAAVPASLRGVATVDSATTNVTIVSEHEGEDLVITTSAPVGATLTPTESQDPAGVTLPFGRFVVNDGPSPGGDGLSIAVLPDGAAAADVVGVTVRPHVTVANLGSRFVADVDGYVPPAVVSVMQDGDIEMLNVGGDAAADAPVFCVVATAGGNNLGDARGTADGANTVALAKTNARWVEATPQGQSGPVHVRF